MAQHEVIPEGLARLDEEVRGRGLIRGGARGSDVAHPDAALLAELARRREGAEGEGESQGHGPALPMMALVIGATGVVFGDIGTSPLYSMRESLATPGLAPDASTIRGVASLIFWALTLVVTLKYLVVIMRADNHGEPLAELPLDSLPVLPDDAIYFLSDRSFLATDSGSMSALSERLYAALHRNSASPTAYFGLPTDRVVTLATMIDL